VEVATLLLPPTPPRAAPRDEEKFSFQQIAILKVLIYKLHPAQAKRRN